jgi:hypothetical protein
LVLNIQLGDRYGAKSVEASEQLAVWLGIADGMHVGSVAGLPQANRESQGLPAFLKKKVY